MKSNRLSAVFAAAIMAGLSASLLRVAEDAGGVGVPSVDAPTLNTDVAVPVPAEHQSAVERFVALLKSGEQWIVDNVHAALTHFESLVTPADEAAPNGEQKGAEDA